MEVVENLGIFQIIVGSLLIFSQILLFYFCVNPGFCEPIAGVYLSIGYIYGKILQTRPSFRFLKSIFCRRTRSRHRSFQRKLRCSRNHFRRLCEGIHRCDNFLSTCWNSNHLRRRKFWIRIRRKYYFCDFVDRYAIPSHRLHDVIATYNLRTNALVPKN